MADPDREQTAAVLRRWGVGDGDRIVFYDDIGLNRQAIRGYWLLRLYRFPKERLHILDGGIEAWRRAGQRDHDRRPRGRPGRPGGPR